MVDFKPMTYNVTALGALYLLREQQGYVTRIEKVGINVSMCMRAFHIANQFALKILKLFI